MRCRITSAAFRPLSKLPWLRTALLTTIPSGDRVVVRLRGALETAMLGKPCSSIDALVSPRVRHIVNDWDPADDITFVGASKNPLSTTPFSCPYQAAFYNVDDARDYLKSRADAVGYMRRLSGKVLVCDCTLPRDICWAEILRAFFDELVPDDSSVSPGSGSAFSPTRNGIATPLVRE